MRGFSRFQKIDPIICGKRPVVVFTGSIQPCKWFLMEKTAHSVTACHFLQNTHHNLVMICCNIYRGINRSQLMLCRSNLIMLCLGCHAQLPALLIYFFHICGNSLTDGSEIMIVHLLSLRRHCSEKSTACINQVFSLHIFLFINKEVLLFSTNGRCNTFGCSISK